MILTPHTFYFNKPSIIMASELLHHVPLLLIDSRIAGPAATARLPATADPEK